MNKYLDIYVGTSDENWQDCLCLDIIVGSKEISVEEFPYLTGGDFLEVMGKVLNSAKLLSKELGLPIKLDFEEIQGVEVDADFDDASIRNINLLIKETLE